MRDRLIRRIDVRQNAQRALEVDMAVLVGTGVTGGPVEKLDAEALLQIADVFADGGAREPQLPSGFRETAEFDHFHEGTKAREFVHGVPASRCYRG